MAQDYPHIEIIVSDNASTDGTEAIARAYAEKDARIRYWRNAENLGVVRNFGQSFALSRGRYFTWLACDDLLSASQYIRTTVAFLESNPDVMVCGSDVHMLDLEGPGQVTTWTFPQIHPDRDPRDVRSVYFRLPQDPACFAIYGMFRREALEGAIFGGRTYRGQPVIRHMEFFMLVPTLTRGRIVALPGPVRTYRRNELSSWHREAARLSGLDELLLDLHMKIFLLTRALRFPAAWTEKLPLIALTLRNFLPDTLRTTRGEARRLRAAAEQRRQLILTLRMEIDKRRTLLGQAGVAGAGVARPWPPIPGPVDVAVPWDATAWLSWKLPSWLEPARECVEMLLTDFFRPPSPERQNEKLRDYLDSIALREVCEKRLGEIHRLTAEADRCLALMQSPGGEKKQR